MSYGCHDRSILMDLPKTLDERYVRAILKAAAKLEDIRFIDSVFVFGPCADGTASDDDEVNLFIVVCDGADPEDLRVLRSDLCYVKNPSPDIDVRYSICDYEIGDRHLDETKIRILGKGAPYPLTFRKFDGTEYQIMSHPSYSSIYDGHRHEGKENITAISREWEKLPAPYPQLIQETINAVVYNYAHVINELYLNP